MIRSCKQIIAQNLEIIIEFLNSAKDLDEEIKSEKGKFSHLS